jgi:hypothetical protein
VSSARDEWPRSGVGRGLAMVARAAVVASTLALTACATARDGASEANAPAVEALIQATGVRDVRGAYREALCRRLRDDAAACDDVLLRLPGEELPPAVSTPTDLAQRYRLAFVPGLLADCAGPLSRPFASVEDDLSKTGVDVRYLSVAGRGTSAANAEQLAQWMGELPGDARPLIAFVHSKGLPDVLELFASHPEKAKRIAAIVSIAGASQGSLLADGLQAEYRRLLSSNRLLACKPGSGNELEDLRRDVRLDWWRQHGASVSVPVFSLVTMPRPERVTPFMAATYRKLASIDPHNDGMLFWHEQIVPGSHLLGFVNADHWAVVQSASRDLPVVGVLLPDDGVPRTLLVLAAVEVVDITLRGIGTIRREGGSQTP